MNFDSLRIHLLDKPGVTEETPFGPETLVYKVMGKMFALVAWQATPLRVTLKSEPLKAEALRLRYPAVQPGYYMNKRHWNTVTLDGSIPVEEVTVMIDESYILVVGRFSKAMQQRLQAKGA